VYTYIKREPKGSQRDGVRFRIPRAVEGKSELQWKRRGEMSQTEWAVEGNSRIINVKVYTENGKENAVSCWCNNKKKIEGNKEKGREIHRQAAVIL